MHSGVFVSTISCDRYKSCMVAERLRTLQLRVISRIPTHSPIAAMDVLLNQMADEAFVPAQIADYQGEVIGDVLLEFSCKALLAAECFMIVGGYIVKGIRLSCGKRARAVRRADGLFERIEPSWLMMPKRPKLPLQPPQQPLQRPWDDTSAAASDI